MMLLCLDANGIINVVGIVVNAVLGIWIAISVQNGFAEKRFLKEHFIKTLNSIGDDYERLIELICEKQINAVLIKNRLKNMTSKIKSFESHIEKVYGIKNSQLGRIHGEIQAHITGLDEYNDQFKCDVVTLEQSSITELLKMHGEFADSLTQCLVEINSAKTKRGFDKVIK